MKWLQIQTQWLFAVMMLVLSNLALADSANDRLLADSRNMQFELVGESVTKKEAKARMQESQAAESQAAMLRQVAVEKEVQKTETAIEALARSSGVLSEDAQAVSTLQKLSEQARLADIRATELETKVLSRPTAGFFTALGRAIWDPLSYQAIKARNLADRLYASVMQMSQTFTAAAQAVQHTKKTVIDSPVANQADAWQAIRSGALLIDVRRPAEFASGHIDGAINIPVDQIAARIAEVASDKQRSIVVYCLGGMRSASAQQILHGIGYSQVIDGGGYEAMKAAEPK